MAIKISGTTVINDSRELENLGDGSQFIRKPTITSPTAAETDVDVTPTITGSAYDALFSNTRDYREFQIDLATGDFSSPVVSEQVNADSLTVSAENFLDGTTEHKVRIRDVDINGVESEFSDEVTFTTLDPLTVLGAPTSGGFYMGTICAASTCYYLIVAPLSTGFQGDDGCQWKTSETSTSGTSSLVDGYANTYPALANSTHPAGNWTATRTINGFSDWYLPAIDEIKLFYNNGAGDGAGDPLPEGEDYPAKNFWTSTEISDGQACFINLSLGSCFNRNKDLYSRVRAVRRIPV